MSHVRSLEKITVASLNPTELNSLKIMLKARKIRTIKQQQQLVDVSKRFCKQFGGRLYLEIGRAMYCTSPFIDSMESPSFPLR
jgi:hypothetical protein